MRLLVVEDDRMIGEAVVAALTADGDAVDWVRDGEAADTALRIHDYDLVLLDLGLPRRDGLSVLKALRARQKSVPVLVTTARDAVADRVAGLDAGADDYLVKPYDLDELQARIRALARRASGRIDSRWQRGDVVVDPMQRWATRGGVAVELSGREWAVLAALLERPGTALSRAQLEEKLYGWGEEIGSNAVEVYVHGLRRKLGTDLIRTIRGVGYRVAASEPATTRSPSGAR
jgi:two-component system OmpR family response regulator